MLVKPLTGGQRLVGLLCVRRACVCWFSRTQKCVTLSTTEAEYVALADTIKEAMFMRYVWSFIFRGLVRCALRFEDNEGAKHLAQNPKCTSNSKHIDVRHHFLRELIFKGKFIIAHVETDEQHADFLTKPLNYCLLYTSPSPRDGLLSRMPSSA